ncbi:hypothetical protein ACI3QN_13675, partial [Propionibacterium freudenreichii]|uniref:hypothetical protein n=1 Tax=Propionibacterium freudenreichii TaxID=1744 RepID=UPI0038523169
WDKKDAASKKKDPEESKRLQAEKAAIKAHESTVAANNATTRRMADAWAAYYNELDAMREEDRKSDLAAEKQAIKDNDA